MRIEEKKNREEKVLELLIKHHTRSAEPVGSRAIGDKMGLSSATIRNIMFDLEEEGLIWQPHTSAGRIPSAKGYRLYVDSLLGSGEFPIEDIDAGVLTYQKSDSIEDVILRGMHLCSEATSQASLAFFPSLKIGERLVERLEERLTGMFEHLYGAGDKVYLEGAHRLVEQPEFKDAEKISAILRILEDKKNLLEMLESGSDVSDIRVYIGRENSAIGFAECTLIMADYIFEDDIHGSLGVIGPIRMEYDRVIPAVKRIAGSISRLLDEML